MDIEKLFDKYIEEPKRKRNRVNIIFRLNYKDAPEENVSILIITMVMILLLTIIFWFCSIISQDSFISLFILTIISFAFFTSINLVIVNLII